MIYGTFKSISDINYYIEIRTDRLNYEIGSSKMMSFTGDPITITQNTEDTFQAIRKTTATINLLVNTYIGDYIFTGNDREIEVAIYKDTKNDENLVFFGYISPNTFNQDFAEEYTEIEINCQDYLCTLENHKWKEELDYNDVKVNADTISFKTILETIFGNRYNIYYDTSVRVRSTNDIFNVCGISETLFMGDEEDDLWTQEEVLTELLQYLNLHIIQHGKNIFIYHNKRVSENSNIRWANVVTGSTYTDVMYYPQQTLTVNKDFYKSNDTQISLSDVYNQIVVNCELEESDNFFKSPLESDSLVSPYSNKNSHILATFRDSQGKYKTSKYYMQVKDNPNWTLRFYDGFEVKEVKSEIQYDEDGRAINQYSLPKYMHNRILSPLLISMSEEEDMVADMTDTSYKGKISMTDNLIISVNGTENNSKETAAAAVEHWNFITSKLEIAGGMVEYKSNQSAGVISPNDDETTNYIVFSGKIALQPPLDRNGNLGYFYIRNTNYHGYILEIVNKDGTPVCGYIVECELEELNGKIAIQNGLWYKVDNYMLIVETNPDVEYYSYQEKYPTMGGLNPSKDATLLPYLNSEYYGKIYNERYGTWMNFRSKEGYDDIDKIPILVCQLKVGNKYAVEIDVNQFEWLTFEECQARGLENTFTLGFNPKVDDYFLMKDWDISNNMRIDSNTDAEGTGIPIKKSDNLNGKVEFRILSPSYPSYQQEIRKHPTAFRHTKWWNTELPFMEFVGNIYISNFECKLYTDNGGFNNTQEKDLVYMSDVFNNSIVKKDDITFRFNTALTADECNMKGISTLPKLSNVIDMESNNTLSNIQNVNTSNKGKAEELYIDDYYNEYSDIKLIIDSTFDVGKFGLFYNYTFSYFNDKTFRTLGYEYNLKYDNVKLNLKQI